MGRGMRIYSAFIGGRLLGIMLLGLVIALYGWYMDLDSRVMILIFAVLSLVFGILVIMRPQGLSKIRLLRNCEAGGCQSCGNPENSDRRIHSELGGYHHSTENHHTCSSCSLENDCPSRSTRTRTSGLEMETRSQNPRHFHPEPATVSIFLLGSVRGATPCLKILLLAPLILTLPLRDSMILVALYALSSSIYPILGILSASFFGMAAPEERRPQLTRAGAVMMIGIGIYYLYKFWTYACPGAS